MTGQDSAPHSRAATPTGVPVAVIGIGCRFPGAYGPDELWRLLSGGVDATTEVPRSRYDIDAYHDPRPGTPGRIVSRRGGFLDQVDQFDAGYFGVAPREAEELDPQQRLLLETCAEALDDAGLTADELAGSRAGVFVGGMASTYWEMLSHAGILDVYAASGGARSMLSGRLSFAFDLRGPSVSVDTACSSGLAALHMAYQSVRAGECGLAVAGGVNLVISAAETIPFSQAKMLAPDGRCKFGSATGDGFVRSEGVAVVVLKPLARAEADRDAIYAVIYGSAVGNDGQSGGYLLTPSQPGQEETLRAAYANAGVSPALVDYVEAHGTGTPAGDPVELGALGAVLGPGRPAERPLLVGSVKTNIGHTEAASGLAGFIKAVLALRHRTIPASLHAEVLTDAVDWAALPLTLTRTACGWPETGRPALAGVSSFGISGTNAHVVVGEYQPGAPPPVAEERTDPAELLVLSAPDPRGLAALAGRYADLLGPGGAGRELPLRDLCFSAATRRRHHECRLTAVGSTGDEIAERLRAFVAGEARRRLGSAEELLVDGPGARPTTVFVYPGQGSQWDGMGRELLAQSPVFRDILTECDVVIRQECGWSVLDRLTGVDTTPASIDTVQPTLWAMETALTGLLRSWGIEPDYVVGHSMGEVAAAGAAGALSLADAGAVICRRSKLLREVAGLGAMISVELSIDDARAELAGYEHQVSIAVSNSPTSTVLSGDPAALESIVKTLDDRGVFCRPVKVDVASHSPQMDLLREDLSSALADLSPRAGSTPLFSTVDNAIRDGAELDAGYWVRNLREPVRFGAVISQLAEQGAALFVEISPHPILLPAMRECLDLVGGGAAAVPCLRRDEPEWASMLDTAAGAWRTGYPVDWARVYGEPAPSYVRLPDYPWQRQRYWFTAPAPAPAPGAVEHPLVGALTAQPDGSYRWAGPLDPARHPYLLDHRVQGTVVLPGTAYLEMVYAAARQLPGGAVPVLADVHYENALFFQAGAAAPTLAITLRPSGDAWSFEVTSQDSAEPGELTVHATGAVRFVPAPAAATLALDELTAGCPEQLAGSDFYRHFTALGNEWAGAFQGIAELRRGENQALGRIGAPAGVDITGYHTHPALLDACGQVLAALIPPDSGAAAFVLGGIDEVLIHAGGGRPAWSHAVRVTPWRSDSFSGDITVADASGTALVEIKGLRLQFLQPPGTVRDPRGWLHSVEWIPGDVAEAPAASGGRLLVFADRAGIGAALAGDIVVTAGDSYRQVEPGRYEIDPTAPEDYQRLLADIAPGGTPTDVLHLWSVDADQPADATASSAELATAAERLGCVSILHLVRALATGVSGAAPRLWLATRGAQSVRADDPGGSAWQAPVWGFGRTLAREYRDLRVTLVDLDPTGAPADSAAGLRRELSTVDGEDQIALRRGGRLLARLLPSQFDTDPAPAAGLDPDQRRFELRTATPGILDGLALEPVARTAPGPGEVEVRADFLALNYRDVLLAMGHYPSMGTSPALFVGEAAGVVTRVGPGVAGLRPGDEVVALALTTPSASHMCVNAHLVRPKPARLSLQEAATLPVGFLTAYHSLVELAQLREGERVLIHHATGGVGLAAVQIAQRRGAEVYATAGSPEKRALLTMMGVAHVADSRGLDFADSVLAATRGEGMDVVLNTLAGEGLEKSLSVLAPRGRYVELSRRDLVDGTRLDMRLLARSISFFVVDVVDLGLHLAARAGAILDEVLALVQAGVFHPLPHHVFPAADLVGAFRFMAQSRQVGKVLLDVTELTAGAEPVPDTPARSVRVDPGASYLITGGLGELGRVVADWLVREGARHLVLVGRTPLAADGEPANWLELLRRHGVEVEYAAADVADEAELGGILRRREAQGLPAVRGVVHAAGVILYRAVSDLDATALSAVLRPKVAGSWALHRLFAGQPLDFFVLFSSGSAVLSSPMLGAYSAANAGLDGLAAHRRAAGLPALSVNWGFWSVGMPSRAAEEQGRPINPQGMDTFTPREGIEALRYLLARDASHAVVIAADWPRWRAAYPEAATAPLLRELVEPGRAPIRRAPVTPPAALPLSTTAAPAAPTRTADGLTTRAATVPAASASQPAMLTPAEPWRAVLVTQSAPEPVAPPVPATRAAAGLAATLTSQGEAEQYLRQVVAAVLGLSVADVQIRRTLKRQGLDSLMAVEVRTRVQRDLGLFLPIAKMLGGQSIADIAADILVQLAGSADQVPA